MNSFRTNLLHCIRRLWSHAAAAWAVGLVCNGDGRCATAAVDPTLTLAPTNYTNFESPQTNPLRLSPDGTRLFAANTADNRVSVFSLANPSAPALIAEIPVGLEPVAVWPVSNEEVWVVNHVSDSISVVSVSRGIVTDTLAAGDEPCDIVVAGTTPRAYVTAARSKEVRVFNLTTHALVATIPLLGEHPRAMAVSADGTKVYVAFALSGNGTTLWPRTATLRPPNQPAPTNPLLPPAPRTSLIIDESNPNYSTVIPYTLLDHDVAEIHTSTQTVSRYFDTVGTVNLGLAVSPANGDLFVANTEARNRVFFIENIRGHVVDNRLTRVTTGVSPVVTAFDLNPGINYATLPNSSALGTALAQPAGVVFDPSGSFMWVAAFGTDRIAKVDTDGVVLARIEVGNSPGATADPANKRGPRGLALNAAGTRLYVQHRIANTLTVIDTANDTVGGEIPVGSYDPTPLAIKHGRGYFYDAKLSGNGIASCASCHVDGATDNLAWDLGDRAGNMVTIVDPITGTSYNIHPMKGPLVTQTMAGLADFDPYHWRGDMPNLEAFNINFDILLGASQIPAADMQQLVDYLKSIRHMSNPNLNLDRSLPTNLGGGDANVGQTLFQAVPSPTGDAESCFSCHHLPTMTFRREIIPAEGASAAFARKVPTLRQVYKKAGFNNAAGAISTMGFGQTGDGSVAARGGGTGFNALSFVAFQQSWDTGTAPAVGTTRMVTQSTVSNAALTTDWNTLEARVIAGDNDLIVHGEVDGTPRGFLYDAASGLYVNGAPGVGPFTRAQLTAKAQAGAIFTVMGVAPGNGMRVGIDRDGDGIPDDWETAFDLNPNSPADATLDADSDSLNNLTEYLIGTAPNIPSDPLELRPVLTGTSPPFLAFEAIPGRTYTLQHTESLNPAAWMKLTDVTMAATNRQLQIIDPEATNHAWRFYRIIAPLQP